MWIESPEIAPASLRLHSTSASIFPQLAQSRRAIVFSIIATSWELRESLALAHGGSLNLRLSGAFSDLASALSDPEFESTEIVLLEVITPLNSSLDCLRTLKQLRPDLVVIILTSVADRDLVMDAFRNGAGGFLLEGATTDEVSTAIRDAVAGGSPMSSAIARVVIRSLLPKNPRATPDLFLTHREQELLDLLSKGLRYKEVAEIMGVTLNTVRYYVRRAYGKLQARSRTEALRRYREVC